MSTFEIISKEDLLVNLENPDFKILDVSTSLIPSALAWDMMLVNLNTLGLLVEYHKFSLS